MMMVKKAFRQKSIYLEGKVFRAALTFLMAALFFFSHSSGACAQTSSIDWSPNAKRLLQEGMNELFSYQLQSAEAKFDSLIQLEPQRPEGYFYKSDCYLLTFIPGGENMATYERFLELADQSVRVSEFYLEHLAKTPSEKALGQFFLAESHFAIAVADARAQNVIGAALNAHSSKGYYKDALETDSAFYDAGKGVGMFYFFSSLIPSSFRWLATIFGYEQNRQEGVRLMQLAAQKGFYTKNETRFYLAMFTFLFHQNKIQAEKELLTLLSEYPHSTILNYALGLIYLDSKEMANAEAYFVRAAGDLSKDSENSISKFALFRLAELHFRLNDFEKAKAFLLTFEKKANYALYTAQLHYLLGVSEWMLGENQQAKEHFEKAKASGENPDELFMQRRAKFFLEHGISETSKAILLGKNAFDSGRYPAALTYLEPLLSTPLKKDELAEVHYLLARIQDETGQSENAIANYQACYKLFAQKERYLAPFSRYYLGKLYAKQGHTKLAYEELEKSLRYISYDFEDILKEKAKYELEKIAAGQTEITNQPSR
ncbi:Tetratricopeptide TPR_2 repeat protein [Chloroherpeton thalassium ATCC 35110]|uniref:Tetratricopeptide TPR_2 repeat protein n=1 Tax=Chloroherpeton thalassium (strain ATCC 35110 / GB-78) TaxID=517418 RepID=B3QU13_CHLT3|nr:tetratricopeptide repeat protein [Chloroherpeton thalassium]ACF12811.1 Tetratricopeptide TPR_2 repeat protein [Chloroherpeton thalassium ATCC 35110]